MHELQKCWKWKDYMYMYMYLYEWVKTVLWIYCMEMVFGSEIAMHFSWGVAYLNNNQKQKN